MASIYTVQQPVAKGIQAVFQLRPYKASNDSTSTVLQSGVELNSTDHSSPEEQG